MLFDVQSFGLSQPLGPVNCILTINPLMLMNFGFTLFLDPKEI